MGSSTLLRTSNGLVFLLLLFYFILCAINCKRYFGQTKLSLIRTSESIELQVARQKHAKVGDGINGMSPLAGKIKIFKQT